MRAGGYKFVAVVAMARNRVIGNGGQLPWHLPDDLKRVKDLTIGRPLIMGRATYDAIGKPLPGRGNIVLTRQKDYTRPGAFIANKGEAAVAFAMEWIAHNNASTNEIIIFGGGQIYAEFMPQTGRIELTEVDCFPDGDAFFPEIDPAAWHETEIATHPPANGAPGYTYKTLTLKG